MRSTGSSNASLKKKKGDSEKEAKSEDEKKVEKKKEKKEEPAFQFGWINIMLIFGVGALTCIKMGLFDGDNVPDFVAKRDDLEYYFKSLAPPEVPNKTDGKRGGKEKDPFAAPKEEEKVRY